jgi:hypothetical protein
VVSTSLKSCTSPLTKQGGHRKLLYRTDAAAYARIRERQLGQRILFTESRFNPAFAWAGMQRRRTVRDEAH